jgi:hypothetical protein
LAVTTATLEGVATPVTVASAGAGAGAAAEADEDEDLLHPERPATNATAINNMTKFFMISSFV